ncbi:HEPN family nuclease [Elizabethkingia anophelis]|uniref:HEPN family nuclease n=1 Tax=Elizabethkingia anophelis TaxID=1117645 RepID=UPI0004109A02|nr:HEPN family nuclease [Elizabethkingia anophelis]AKH94751.1 hypothetical protein M876_09240 [Elizabethkingia anophelis FMS-007]MCT3745454.1 hypothetical protein [Elizabethkingia anophelis]MCT3923516.1 hypothetical protein [Elizabethkingia anophelis]MCT4062249.1 hypothetical protein [Elizabethkingia anophelis]MCT4108540.1 hypothetical protein [Elizabethkingia anophelis]
MKYTPEENLIIQVYFTFYFLYELDRNEFLNSNFYKNMQFNDKFIKESLPQIGIMNQGTLVQTLYSMLVLPKELISNQFKNEFSNLNIFLKNKKTSAESTYPSDSLEIDFIRHIRNSVAHGTISFKDEDRLVIFYDKNKIKGHSCIIKITLENISLFIVELQKLFFKYIEFIKKKYSMM